MKKYFKIMWQDMKGLPESFRGNIFNLASLFCPVYLVLAIICGTIFYELPMTENDVGFIIFTLAIGSAFIVLLISLVVIALIGVVTCFLFVVEIVKDYVEHMKKEVEDYENTKGD